MLFSNDSAALCDQNGQHSMSIPPLVVLVSSVRAHQHPINAMRLHGDKVVTASCDHTLKVGHGSTFQHSLSINFNCVILVTASCDGCHHILKVFHSFFCINFNFFDDKRKSLTSAESDVLSVSNVIKSGAMTFSLGSSSSTSISH